MKTIYLISCCKEKLSHPAKAVDLYQSVGFKRRISIAKANNPDAILILSAKHHIVELDQVLAPYDVCFSNQTIGEQKKWAEICLDSLSKRFNLKKDKFVILAVEDYYKNLVGQFRIENYELPDEATPTPSSTNNSNLELLKSFLTKNNKAYCDDCLSKLTGIKPRQQINQLCNKHLNVIHKNDCGMCTNCRKYKIVRSC